MSRTDNNVRWKDPEKERTLRNYTIGFRKQSQLEWELSQINNLTRQLELQHLIYSQ